MYAILAMTLMLAQREYDYFAETVICANCYIVAKNKWVTCY